MSTKGSFLTEDLRRKALGMEGKPTFLEVEKGHIVRFAQAVGDPNPWWNDEAEARKSRHGGLIAPPTFLRALIVERPKLPVAIPFQRRLDGASEWEYFEPIRVGDRIRAVARLTDVSEREGRLGTMLITVAEITYTNQFDEVVATQRSTHIEY